ncbi:MAG: phosphodiesterase [Nitrospinae bacterium CG11_big_fil_rev_8_21_14_0_20_45_15]|nr:MAG: phosphodiesterase [Nitrospinae bacterium CG11_big_fil_rev_8_21_14_0_20_45_15]
MRPKKLMVIGLDCAAPELVFDRWRDRLPNLNRLMSQGIYGPLESSMPPITVPAWACMMSGKDPGYLGVYGFRNRKDRSYDNLGMATSLAFKEDMVWDHLGRRGKKSVVLSFPPSYPVKPIVGWSTACFLTPNSQSAYTHPPELKEELEKATGPYIPDVMNFRTEDKDNLLEQIHAMAKNHFDQAEYMAKEKDWDFFMMVEMGVDRIHHGLWKYCSPSHPRFVPGNPYENSIRDFYIYSDQRIGKLLELAGPETAVLVVSDHGARDMIGGICINEWLIQEGYLKLNGPVEGLQNPSKVGIDWENTKVWAEGGYYSRIFLNVRGREPQGCVAPEDYENLRTELTEKLTALGDETGNPIGTIIYKPEDIYKQINGIAPDLLALFGDLSWRAVGTVGHGSVHTRENDTGPDDANHARDGLYIYSSPQGEVPASPHRAALYDIAPSILKLYGIASPENGAGKTLDFF